LLASWRQHKGEGKVKKRKGGRRNRRRGKKKKKGVVVRKHSQSAEKEPLFVLCIGFPLVSEKEGKREKGKKKGPEEKREMEVH